VEEDEDYQRMEIGYFFLSFAQDQPLEHIRSEWCILSSKNFSRPNNQKVEEDNFVQQRTILLNFHTWTVCGILV
jgi:hypothetical protein